ncbi:Mitochondrial inner membrane protease subunit 1 [Ceratocystis lukuohia]|uniref:Mitochondrial inner membrane protease subunit 1 n=1 Tax=Ceratocystis lukuohia TaxID=2019550 RepID=A0ABR4MDC7_9PEZI
MAGFLRSSWASPRFRGVVFSITVAIQVIGISQYTFDHIVAFGPAQGPSMVPTFTVAGEGLVINRLCRIGRNVQVGDLVAYDIPINKEIGVKRVIGLPGDYVLVGNPGSSQDMLQVPEGHCWLVGDNLKASRDCRDFGPLPLALVTGKVVYRYKFPFWDLKRIKNGLLSVK